MMASVRLYSVAAAGLMLAAVLTGCRSSMTVTVSNPLPLSRSGEMAELASAPVTARFGHDFVVRDAEGNQLPWQLTSDSTLIFPVAVGPSSTVKYKILAGKPAEFAPKVYGRKFPEHKDNMNWENDLAAYVAYGPALQQRGERGFGYDVWTKSVDTLVIERRNWLRDHGKSLHKDHGNGMDAYIVANTLGAGTAALLDDEGQIIYPWAWRDYRITDCGPLRFQVELVYNPMQIPGGTEVTEHRRIRLDAGSDLNMTTVCYDALPSPRDIAPGIVIHKQNPYGELADSRRAIIAYADSTDNASNGNGVIYIGAYVPRDDVGVTYKPVIEPARDALGHILAVSKIAPGEDFTYWWGSAWSKNPTGPQSPAEWLDRLRRCADCISNPLIVELK